MATKKIDESSGGEGTLDVEVQAQETPPSSPVPPPVNIGVGGQNWTKTAIPPSERKSIADDPTGESNVK